MLLTLILLLAGCDDRAAPAAAPASRVNAVQAAPPDPKAIDAFCDVRASAADGKPFVAPPLAQGAAPAQAGWRWLNVWATWCGPCIAEMPMLLQWKDKLAADGRPAELLFVSFDDDQAAVDRFAAKHADWPGLGLRITGKDAIAPWLQQMGLDPGTAIPLHVFVDPEGKTRCIRAGALSEADYGTVRRIVSGE